MEIKLNTVLTLDDQKKYIVVAKAEYENSFYDYLLEVSSNEENIIENAVIVKEEVENNDIYVTKIEEKQLLDILVPSLKEKLENKE